MNKITSFLIFSLLLLGVQSAYCAENAAPQNSNTASNYEKADGNYDFENNSYNISDEQIQAETGADYLQKDAKASFWSKIINSSHFSSNTATKTWTPLNKAE